MGAMRRRGGCGPLVEVVSVGNATHPSQILTGLLLLEQQDEISLTWPGTHRLAGRSRVLNMLAACPDPHVAVLVEGKLVYFDLHDSGQLVWPLVGEADSYFKRSYKPSLARQHPSVEPLGLYFEVTVPELRRFEWRRIQRSHSLRERIAALVYIAMSTLGLGRQRWFRPTPESMHAPPTQRTFDRAIFMCRLWDPAEHPGLDPADAADRETVNEFRVRCIRALRDHLGPRFVGGLQHTPYAAKHYPDVLLACAGDGAKYRYLELLREIDVGVATTGLHGSIGGKFSEYVAFSKAIVSEPLQYAVPGDFRSGVNYLGYRTVDECVSSVSSLLRDASKLRRMQLANYRYFHRSMRPDALVRRCILRALERDTLGKAATVDPPREYALSA
jgi:hypothetical protein